MNDNKTYGDNAIIIGGSFAGMVTASVLSKYFKKVTLLERYSQEKVQNHENVPQGNHEHHFWHRGSTTLDKLLPGFIDSVTGAGVEVAYFPDDAHIYDEGWKPKTDRQGTSTLLVSRRLIDSTVRKLLKNYKNVTTLYDIEVTGLLNNFKEKKIIGVEFVNKATNEKSNLYADLVVDATGYDSIGPSWLESLGYEKPAKTEIKSNVYALTRYFHIPDSAKPKWKMLKVKGKNPRIAAGGQVENVPQGAQWSFIITTESGDKFNFSNPEEEFMEVARNLEDPTAYQFFQSGVPLTKVYTFRYPANRRYHYESARNLPGAFLAMGDALFTTNPRQVNGLTNAVLSCEVLDQCLKENKAKNLKEVIPSFFQNVVPVRDQIWNLAIGDSLRYPATEGKRPFAFKFKIWYFRSILHLANDDPDVWLTLWRVIRFESDFKSLFQPSILGKVLLKAIKDPFIKK